MKRGAIQEYDRLKTLTLKEGFDLIRSGHGSVKMGSAKVNVYSLRLMTFLLKGVKCVAEGCVYEGTYFAVERTMGAKKAEYHMNLWGVCPEDQRPVLMTCDHIVARALGGVDKITNTQPMCVWHNSEKSRLENAIMTQMRDLVKREVKVLVATA